MPDTLKLWAKRTWNERGIIETIIWFLTNVCALKKLFTAASGIWKRI